MTLVFVIFGGIGLVFALTAFTGAPFVPTFRKEIRGAFRKLYKLGKGDFVVDLGSGSGVVLDEALRARARAEGIEINPFLVLYSRLRLRGRAKVRMGNIFSYHFPAETTVVYLFGEDRDMKKFVALIERESKRLGKPLWLISQAFEVEGLEPVKRERAFLLYKIDGRKK